MRRGDSEHHLNELQRRARAAAISADPRDGHETLMQLLQPPRRILGMQAQITIHTSTGTCAARHCQGPVNHGQVPRENTRHTSACCNVMLASATTGSPCIPIMTTVPLPPPGLNELSSLISCCFNPILSWRRTDVLRRPTHRGRPKSKTEP